jgi:hypothetical protein
LSVGVTGSAASLLVSSSSSSTMGILRSASRDSGEEGRLDEFEDCGSVCNLRLFASFCETRGGRGVLAAAVILHKDAVNCGHTKGVFVRQLKPGQVSSQFRVADVLIDRFLWFALLEPYVPAITQARGCLDPRVNLMR